VRAWLEARRPPAVVLDPVMVSTSGARLLDADAATAMRELLPLVDVVTPNLPELAVLLGDAEPEAADWPAAVEQAARLAASAGARVLVKGGHLGGAVSPDALVEPCGEAVELSAERIDTANTHGTCCSLSSALATLYPQTGDWGASAREAKAWLSEAIAAGAALEVGHGHGPVDHFVRLRPVTAAQATGAWWDASEGIRTAIDRLPFIAGLADGTLDPAVFRNYLEQDALYLGEYSRVLARASALAPTRAEQAFWAEGARGCLVTELQLHETWLGGANKAAPSRETRAYLDHLAAAGPDYGTVVAAVLPCYWLYQDLGERLVQHARPGHPFEAWLATYSDARFADATRTAIAYAGAAAANASAEQRLRMSEAFRLSAEHELAFFAQTPAEKSAGGRG
jgi:hydroxymethylpyrimidine/phosphomethylpyrimidine kinase/hydroxymethylpyrimidine kinase/phosphomethylpyrimidine kinase/thiamine-phosphate diphosphorylase